MGRVTCDPWMALPKRAKHQSNPIQSPPPLPWTLPPSPLGSSNTLPLTPRRPDPREPRCTPMLIRFAGGLLKDMKQAWISLRRPAANDANSELLRDTTIQALHQLIVGFREEVEAKTAALEAKDQALADMHTHLAAVEEHSTPESGSSLMSMSGGEPMLPHVHRGEYWPPSSPSCSSLE